MQHCRNALGPGPAAGGQWDGPHGETLYSRRVPCKTVLEVNDNSGRRIPDRLTFELKELRLKLCSFDSSTASSISFLLILLVSCLSSSSFFFLASVSSFFALLSLLLLFLFPPTLHRFLFFISPLRKGVVRRWINDSHALTDSILPWHAF